MRTLSQSSRNVLHFSIFQLNSHRFQCLGLYLSCPPCSDVTQIQLTSREVGHYRFVRRSNGCDNVKCTCIVSDTNTYFGLKINIKAHKSRGERNGVHPSQPPVNHGSPPPPVITCRGSGQVDRGSTPFALR